MGFVRSKIASVVRKGVGGAFGGVRLSSPHHAPRVDLSILGGHVHMDKDFSAPMFDATLCRRSAFGSLFIGNLSMATNLHLRCRGVSVGCFSSDGVSFSFFLGVTVPPLGVPFEGLGTTPLLRKGRGGSCMRLLPGLTFGCSFDPTGGVCMDVAEKCHSKNCGMRVFSRLVRDSVRRGVVRTVLSGTPRSVTNVVRKVVGRRVPGCKGRLGMRRAAICGPRCD